MIGERSAGAIIECMFDGYRSTLPARAHELVKKLGSGKFPWRRIADGECRRGHGRSGNGVCA